MSIVPMTFCFFFNDTATTEIYTLSLHDALPISERRRRPAEPRRRSPRAAAPSRGSAATPRPTRARARRSEEHTSELQSQSNLVCRLLLEKKKHPRAKSRLAQHYIPARAPPATPA